MIFMDVQKGHLGELCAKIHRNLQKFIVARQLNNFGSCDPRSKLGFGIQ